MSKTNDPTLLFQSSAQLAAASNRDRKIVAAENIGDPIKLSSKVLDMLILDGEAWTGESGWQARRLDLNTGKTKTLYKGHKGPVTSVALYQVGGEQPWLALFTGSWDKTVRVWDANTSELVGTLEGHSDFVKGITLLPTSPALLITTSSDRTFRLWDLSPLETRSLPKSVQVIKEHTRPVETAVFALPPADQVTKGKGDASDSITVWTADSLGVINEWKIKRVLDLSTDREPLKFVKEFARHDTSVAELAPVEDGLWSASMDNTARFHGDTAVTLTHPSYVKSILPYPSGLPYIITGSEDEEIRVWDANTLGEVTPNKKGEDTPLSVVSGHCGEVSNLGVFLREGENGRKVVNIVSAGLDCTIRRWAVDELLNPPKLNYEPVKLESGMTAEEEAELAELLSDDE